MSLFDSPDLTFWHRRRLPVVLQTEAAECGLACVAMVAAYWGHRVDMAHLRQRFSVSIKGSTLRSLMGIAQALKMQTRPVKVDLDELGQLRLPCVLHWNMNHFTVLKRVERNSVVIHDPSFGERRVAFSELDRTFTGVALELAPSAGFTQASVAQKITLTGLIGRVVGLKRCITQLVLLGVALQVVTMAAPFYMQWVIDDAVVSADRALLTTLGTGFLMLVVVQASIAAIRAWITNVLSTDLGFQWMGNVFAHMMKLPPGYFEKRHVGDLVSRFTSIQVIQTTLTTQFVEAFVDGLLVVGTCALMMVYSVPLTVVAGLGVLLYALVRWSLFGAMRNAAAQEIHHMADQQAYFLETVRGMQTVRLFGRGDTRRLGWTNILVDQFNAGLRRARLDVVHRGANALIFNAERVIVVWMAAFAIMDNHFSVGMLFAFMSYKEQFSTRLAALVDKAFELRMLRLHAERVADITLSQPEALPAVPLEHPEALKMDIELRGVGYRYSDHEPFVLKDVDLVIPAGECLAITGASGCGKTTLVKLLLGVLEPAEGEILVGGLKLSQIGLQAYRELVGTVMQEDTLFVGSLGDNISFFDPAPDPERVERCARQAAVHDEIAAMPMGYHTVVGDLGSGLSGGQRQRIFLARALYKAPRLLVLDEATSHLDVVNEQLVNAAIRRIGLTCLIVAHRPETIAMAERVIVLHAGRILRDLAQPGAPLEHPASTGPAPSLPFDEQAAPGVARSGDPLTRSSGARNQPSAALNAMAAMSL